MEFTDPSSTKLKNLSENWNGYHISTKKPENQRHYIAKCLYCEKEFKGKPAELMKHKLNNCSKKSAWPKELRGIGRAEPPIKIQGQELISKFTQNTRPVDETVDQLVLNALVSTSTPFAFVGDPHVKALFNKLNIKLPNRNKLRDVLLPQSVYEVDKENEELLSKATGLTIALDGWTDVSGESFVAVVLVFDGNIIYLGNIDTKSERHTADILKKGLCSLLDKNLTAAIQDKLIAIVSDSAAVMVCMKNMFIGERPKVLSIPCVLHILNLVSKEMVEHVSIEKYVTGAKKIAASFRRSHFWGDQIKIWAEGSGLPAAIKVYTETRWFSFGECLESIIAKEKWFKATFNDTPEGKANAKKLTSVELREILCDTPIFAKLRELAKIMGVINTTIKVLERESATILDVWPELILLQNNLQKIVSSDDSPIFHDAIYHSLRALGRRTLAALHEDAFLVGFFLNPQYRDVVYSKKYSLKMILDKIGSLSMKFKYSLNRSRAIIKKAELYANGQGEFASTETDPRKFWNAMGHSEFKTFALRLLCITPHSASVERLFSRLAYIKDKYQNRMTKETVTNMAKLKIKLRKDLKISAAQSHQTTAGAIVEKEEWEEEVDDDDDVFDFKEEESEILFRQDIDLDQDLDKHDLSYWFDLIVKPFTPSSPKESDDDDEEFEYTLADIYKT